MSQLSNSKPIRYAVVEDDPFWQDYYGALFEKAGNWECVCIADSIEVFRESEQFWAQIQVLFLDIHLPGLSGIEALPELRRSLSPDAKIVILTIHDEDDTLMPAVRHGISGYLLKKPDEAYFLTQLRILERGDGALAPEIAGRLLSRLQDPIPKAEHGLLPKEQLIIERLAHGDSYEEAAVKLHMPLNTFRYYVKKIYKTIGVGNKAAAVRWYLDKR